MAWLSNASVLSRCLTCQVFVNLVVKMEARNIAQRYGIFCVCVCVKLGDSATTTDGKLQQAFGDDAISRAQAFRWHKILSESRTIVEDEQLSGWPSAKRAGDSTARERELVRADRRLTVRTIADEVNMNRETVRLIPTEELGMKKKNCVKMVPRNLTEQQLVARLSAVFDIQMHYGDTAAPLVTGSRTLRLLIISKSKIGCERTPFWVNRRRPDICNAGLK